MNSFDDSVIVATALALLTTPERTAKAKLDAPGSDVSVTALLRDTIDLASLRGKS